MRWIECAVQTTPAEIDDMCIRLEELGVGGMVVEDEQDFKNFLENNHQYWDYVDEDLEKKMEGVSRIKFYLSDDEDGRAVLESVRNSGLEVSTGFVEDSDWENNWREYYKPLEIGERLVVVPEWEEYNEEGHVVLRLDPGLIFGTGSHATTRMCLCETERLTEKGIRVLDLGCGSGILGIAALLYGAERVCGCDIDPKAPDVALSNASLNGIGKDRFDIRAGDVIADAGLRKSLGSGYELVLANIVADVIIPLSAHIKEFLAPGGHFVTSGIIEGRQDEVERALINAGFEIEKHQCQEDWHCFTCVIKGDK
jgi:ribosomal protein L11 methyltransferase